MGIYTVAFSGNSGLSCDICLNPVPGLVKECPVTEHPFVFYAQGWLYYGCPIYYVVDIHEVEV